MCVLLHLLICTVLRAHTINVEALYKINNYYYVCLAVSCHLYLLAEWPESFTCYCGGRDTEIRVSTESEPARGENILPPIVRRLEPVTFRSRVRRCNHWAIPAPQQSVTTLSDEGLTGHPPQTPRHQDRCGTPISSNKHSAVYRTARELMSAVHWTLQ